MPFDTSCIDWRDRIVSRRSLIPAPIYIDEAEAALSVFKSLRVVDVPKKPTFGEICEEWVFDFVRAIFGAYDRETGHRLIREFFLLISKKNSKSTIAAGIMITALVRNWRHSAELLLLAPTIEVANNAFIPARDMVWADEELNTLLHVQEHTRSITHRLTKAVLQIVAADSDTVSGKKAAFVLIDELWIFGKRAKADGMLREATGGLAARPEGFVIWLSTQSDESPTGVFKAKLQYARDVRDGKIEDTSFMPVIYEFPEDLIKTEAYLDPDYFYVTNPNLGRSVSRDWLISEFNKVRHATGGELQVFLAKHLNVEIGLRLSNDRWPAADYWEAASDSSLTALDEVLGRSEVVTIGIDGGGLDDLLGLAVLGREKGTRRWLLWTHAFAHPIVLERRKDIATRLHEFEAEGSLTFCDVNDDMDALATIVAQVKASGLLPEKQGIGFDPNNISSIIEAIIAVGIEKPVLHRLLQGPALAPAINMLPRKLMDKSLLHGGSAMMNWCVGNSRIERRGNSPLLTKQAAGVAKVDPVIATICAAMLMSWNPAARTEPKYQMFFA